MTVTLFDPGTDTAQLAALHAASFPDPWDGPAIAALLATPGTFAFHHPDGFVLARTAGDEAEILTLAVMTSARGKGLGRLLLQAAINQAQALGAVTMFLEVGVDNPAALALYYGLGFTRVGARKAYYAAQPGSGDALVLRLPLPAKFA